MSIDVEFGTRGEANEVRGEYAEVVCPVDDDRRRKTVAFVSDVDDDTLQELRTRAAASRADLQGGGGQARLTDRERDRIDFSVGRASVPHAQSVKGIARDAGVDDWTSYYDPQLTVDEHREVMERAARDEAGARMDAERTDEQRAAELQAQAGGGDCEHARGHCEHGDPDACEFLTAECGLDDDQVAQLLDADAVDDPDDAELDGPALGAFKRAWQGYKGATADLAELLDDIDERWEQAQQSARAVNRIREAHGQEPLHFENLEERQARLTDLVRKAAADCHECHADHTEHSHPTDTGAREELDAFLAGADETPVGVGDNS